MFRSIPIPPRKSPKVKPVAVKPPKRRATAPTSISPEIHAAELLTVENLRELLTYCLDSGVFRWRVSAGRVKAGGVAGTINPTTGYQVICVNGKNHLAHRLAWLYVHGVWPSDQIDHINRDRADNRIGNLREATSGENKRNMGKPCTNTSGHVGVYWNKAKRKWRAQIEHERKHIHLGYYVEQADAIAARVAGEIKYWGVARSL